MPKRKADPDDPQAKRPRRAAPVDQLFIDFHWDEPEVELPPGHVAIVHIWGGYVDVSFEGPQAHTLDDLVEDAEAEVRNRLESCAHLPPGDHVVFRTRPGEGLLEQATHLSV